MSCLYRTRFSHGLSEQFNYRDHLAGVPGGLWQDLEISVANAEFSRYHQA